jgi:SAM-dependent methyltransferase
MKVGLVPENPIEWLALRSGMAPTPLIDTMHTFILAQAVMVATKIGLFEALLEEPGDARAIATRCGTNPSATGALLDALVGSGYLRHRAGRYTLAPVARRWLLRGQAHSLRDWAIFGFQSWDWLTHLGRFVATGRPLDVHAAMSPEAWADYQRAMRSLAGLAAPELGWRTPVPRNARTMLDIGGSHGHYAAVLCRRHHGLHATVLDLPEAVEQAAPLLAAERLGERLVHRAGDARTAELGAAAYDVVLIASLVHHFDAPTNQALVQRAARALRPGGHLVIFESARPAAPGKGGQLAALFNLYFALTSESGLWSYREIADWQHAAGLRPRRPIRFLTTPGAGLQVAVKPPA